MAANNMSTKRTISAYFRRLCEENLSRELLITYDEGLKRMSLTRAEAFTLSCRFAHMLRAEGIRRGDVVVSTIPVSLEAAVVNFGIMLAGAVALTVDVVSHSGEELFHAINKSHSKLVILRSDTDDKAWEVMKSGIQSKQSKGFVRPFSMPRIPTTSHVIVANREIKNENGDGFLDHLETQTASFVDNDVMEEDFAMIFLTSGTTGFPKLARYTHLGIVENIESGKACLNIQEPVKYYVGTSWSWAASVPTDFFWRLTRVSPDLWHHPKDIVRLHSNIIKTEDVRSAFMSPLSAANIIEEYTQEHPGAYVFDQLFVAGVPMNQVLAERLLMGSKLVTVRYGCSEQITITYNHIEKVSDVVEYDCGCLYPGAEVRIVDDNFQDVPDGEPGLVLVKTKATFESYLNDPEKTSKCMTKDGWYNSNDAGYRRPENKHIVIIGRYDHLITHKSTRIFPAWIERPIREHPEVKDVVVVPVPHEVNYQNICACVIKNPGSTLTVSAVQDIIKKAPTQDGRRLMPPHHVIFYNAFPGNARGKIVMSKLIEDVTAAVKKQEIVFDHVHMG